MSGLAKVFLVINLVLALLFLGTSATLFGVRKDFKEQAEELTKLYKGNFDKQKIEIEKLAEKVELQALVISVQQADSVNSDALKKDLARKLSDAEGKLAAATTDIATKQASLDKLTAQIAQVSQETQGLASRLQQSEDSRTKAVEECRLAVEDRNRQFLESVALRDEIAKYKEQNSLLRDEKETLETRLALLTRIGRDPGDSFREILAKVLNVRKVHDTDLVMLSVGSDDKVSEGMVFNVSRGDTYVGEVKVVKVLPKMSGAVVTYRKNGAEIKANDDAKTTPLF